MHGIGAWAANNRCRTLAHDDDLRRAQRRNNRQLFIHHGRRITDIHVQRRFRRAGALRKAAQNAPQIAFDVVHALSGHSADVEIQAAGIGVP